jgi:FkbM family methyltransferase
MNVFNKIVLKLKIEARFLLEQRLGWVKSGDEIIPKNRLKKFIPANAVIIDAGAHIGADSVELARMFPSASIHCFEPVPDIYSFLLHNTRKCGNIKCYDIALSSENGNFKMYVSSGGSDASSSLHKPADHLVDHADTSFEKEIQVQTKSLDDWARDNNITKVDFLWLDMQGHELEVLKASTKILPTVKAIHSEVSLKQTYENAPLYKDYKTWLEGKGFRVEIEAIPKGADMGNVLFVR